MSMEHRFMFIRNIVEAITHMEEFYVEQHILLINVLETLSEKPPSYIVVFLKSCHNFIHSFSKNEQLLMKFMRIILKSLQDTT